jgi:predicted adenylyl cyclase CyaB
MPLEIEIKLALPGLAAMERKLQDLSASPQAVLFETNIFFDWPDARLKSADQGLRLRIEERLGKLGPPIVRLTYKGPRQAGELKTREEIELLVDDAGAAEALLTALGLTRVLVFEKLRRAWCLDECAVTLDTLPGIGDYVEIEGPSEVAVQEARKKLSLQEVPAVRRTYLELLVAERRGGAEGELRFDFGASQRESLRAEAMAANRATR